MFLISSVFVSTVLFILFGCKYTGVENIIEYRHQQIISISRNKKNRPAP